MKEGKHVSKSPFLHSRTGNWSFSLLCNFQGQDPWDLQFGGISLSCVSCNKAFRSSKAWTLVIVLRKARSRIFHKCVTHAYLLHGQATQDGYSLALCASPASVGGTCPLRRLPAFLHACLRPQLVIVLTKEAVRGMPLCWFPW